MEVDADIGNQSFQVELAWTVAGWQRTHVAAVAVDSVCDTAVGSRTSPAVDLEDGSDWEDDTGAVDLGIGSRSTAAGYDSSLSVPGSGTGPI